MGKKIPFFRQLNAFDCGPTCLRMIAKYYGKHLDIERLRKASNFSKDGVSMLGLAEAAEGLGFKTLGVKTTLDVLLNESPLPAIIFWGQYHFVVITPNSKNNKIEIADPAAGIFKLNNKEFLAKWAEQNEINQAENEALGLALLLEPSSFFYDIAEDEDSSLNFGWLFNLVKVHKKSFFQVLLGIFISTILQLILPFLSQSIVDIGIHNNNIHFVYLILIAQLIMLTSRLFIDFIRNRILLYISTHINLNILGGFWIKVMRLPMSFFDTKQVGDLMQRISDVERIEKFITNSALSFILAILNIVVFSFVLLSYNINIFIVFIVASVLYFGWIYLFLDKRRQMDYKKFALASKLNTTTMQLINGMHEIKLHNAERVKRWEWEQVQVKSFSWEFRNLSFNQYQQAGAFFIAQSKDILLTFMVVKLVIDGHLTLGAMVAVQSVLGMMSGPVEQLIGFIQQAQDAKMSMERIGELYHLPEEEQKSDELMQRIPDNKTIFIKNLTFRYPGAGNEPVLRDINLEIPAGKTTAIVGMSGSGKTTLLKLLLGFYELQSGDIKIGGVSLSSIKSSVWRKGCGMVMQDGFIFSESIAANIAVGAESISRDRLMEAAHVANILDFVESLPMGFNTKIGSDGNGISQGQKQRIFIARSVYKQPDYIFFDEATNALDANNEKVIMENLESFFKGRTVVVVAHRLSTVKNADQIIVLDKGIIKEKGTHKELTAQRGEYYKLVKNQLELGA